MKMEHTLQGRSLIFNALFVILNLTGLTFVTLAFHDNFEEQFLTFSFIGFTLLAVTTFGLFLFKGRLLMSSVARILVGGLFIVSGLVKANDPLGFSYKLEEYFEDGALAFRVKEWFGAPGFSLEFFIDYALFLSVVICIVEIVLGVLVIIGGKIKLTTYLMLAMMLFFTFLTWHTANCDSSRKFTDRDTYEMTDPIAAMKIEEAKTNKDLKIISKDANKLVVDEKKLPQCVDDCGCFGDALKGSVGRSLSPKESLWKDIILLYLVLWIFFSQWIIEPNKVRQNLVFVAASMVVIAFFSWVFGWYFPILFGFAALLIALFINRSGGKLLGNYWGSALGVIAICLALTTYVLRYMPLKDYRPYAVGSNLREKMNDGVEGTYENILNYKNVKTGELKSYNAASKEYVSSKIWEDKNWKYIDMEQKAIVPMKLPSITDQFYPHLELTDLGENERALSIVQDMLQDNSIKVVRVKEKKYGGMEDVPLDEFDPEYYPSEDYQIVDTIFATNPEFTELSIREAIINVDRIVIVTTKNIEQANWSNIKQVKELYYECERKGVPFVMIASGNKEQFEKFRMSHNFQLPIFVNDETELKAITRSNPAILVIEKGVVKAKYPHRSLPKADNLFKY